MRKGIRRGEKVEERTEKEGERKKGEEGGEAKGGGGGGKKRGEEDSQRLGKRRITGWKDSGEGKQISHRVRK